MQPNELIRLRQATSEDVEFIMQAEANADNEPYIIRWSREQHLSALDDGDVTYFMIESIQDNTPVGFIILSGLQSAHDSIEFDRIVVTEKGQGYGQAAVRLIQDYAFNELNGHRLWLDVKVGNDRAGHVYEKLGFTVEGTLRDCLKVGDHYASLIIMSILREEYLATTSTNTP